MNQIPNQVWIAMILISYSATLLYLYLKAQAYKEKVKDLVFLITESDHYCGTCIENMEMFTTAEEHEPPSLARSGLPFSDGIVRWIGDHEYLPCFLVVVPSEIDKTGRTVTSDDLEKNVLVSEEVRRRQHDVR